MKRLICFLLVAIAQAHPNEFEAERPVQATEPHGSHIEKAYSVFDGTESPDGRFAVAWGLPKHPDIWTKVATADQANAETILGDVGTVEGDVENYLVDLREKTILCKLSSTYRTVGDLRPNRHHLEVVWSRAGDIVIVNHIFRWDCLAFGALRIIEDKPGPIVDLKKGLDATVRNHLAKSFPTKAPFSKKDLAISFSSVEEINLSTFRVSANGEYPTKNENSWSGEATIRFTLAPSGAKGLLLKALDVQAPGDNKRSER